MKSLALQSTRGRILTKGAKSGCKAIPSRYALNDDVVFNNLFVQGTPTQCVGAFCWPLGYNYQDRLCSLAASKRAGLL